MGVRNRIVAWHLWRLPGRVLSLVLVVHAVTVASVLGTARLFPVHTQHWVFAAVLTGLGIAHLEFSARIGPPCPGDRATPYHDLKTVWNVAAMLLVPPLLATAVIVVTHTYGYLRIYRDDHGKAHRWVYSCATVVLGSQAAAVLLAAGTDTFPGTPGPTSGQAWLVVFAAVAVRWFVNYALVVMASALTRSRSPFAGFLDRMGEQINEAAANGLAIVVAVLLQHGYPVLLVCVYLVVGVLQQTSYYHYWKRERPFDPLTGVYSRVSFVEQAKKILARAEMGRENIGCLLIDLDFFKRINDTHGHNVGDLALVAVAGAIRQEVREDKDIPARWGGEEFVVLVPGVTADTLIEVAERIRRRVRATEVTYARHETRTVRVTASIGAAMYCRDESLLDLVEHADQLMYAAKAAGRDRVCSTVPQASSCVAHPAVKRRAQ